MESIVRFFKSFWQPVILAALSLILMAQLIGWGYAALQMRGIDRLIAAAQEETKPAETSVENPRQDAQAGDPANPGNRGDPGNRGSRGSRGNPDGPGGHGNPELKVSADIFFRRTINYELSAIYKDQAVINGQVVKAGERIGNATLQEIRLASVLIHEDGQPAPRELVMFQGAGGGGGPSMGGPPPGRGSAPAMASTAGGQAQTAPQGPAGMPMQSVGSPQNQRREFIQSLRNGTFDPGNLTPEQRQRFEEMRQRRLERRGQRGGEPGEGPRSRQE